MTRALALLLAFLVTPAFADDVTRPTKTCGNTNYVEEVADGCINILASELDADFQEIIDNVNDITTEQCNPAGLGSACIADGAVTTDKIPDGSITQAKLAAVTFVRNFQAFDITAAPITNTVETTVVSFPAVTTEGGNVILDGAWSASVINVATDATSPVQVGCLLTVTSRWKRDGSTFQTIQVQAGNVWAGTGATSVQTDDYSAIPFPTVTDTPTAASHTYTMTVQLTFDANFGTTNCFFDPEIGGESRAFMYEFFVATTTTTSTSTSSTSTSSTTTTSTSTTTTTT